MKASDIIYFDIDKTLFNASRSSPFLTKICISICRKFKIDEEIYQKTFQAYYTTLESTTHFHPDTFIGFLSAQLHLPRLQLTAAFFDKSIFAECVYPDVVPVLTLLARKYTLGIYSEGFVDYQLKKLEMTNLLLFFHQKYIVISRKKLDDALNLIECSYVIDDKIEVCDYLIKHANLNPIWLNREEEVQYYPVVKASSLHDIEKLIV